MTLALLFPLVDVDAIEERFASWSARTRLGRVADAVYTYDLAAPIADVAGEVEEDVCLVVTDAILVADESVAGVLADALRVTGAAGAVPRTNETVDDRQRAFPAEPYLTLRQFEEAAQRFASITDAAAVVEWADADPGLFATTTSLLREQKKRKAIEVLRGRQVAITPAAYIHRWSPMRAQQRLDLLDRIPTTATSILELGCAEGLLGEAVKRRQRCRFVGIELDRRAALLARRRLDDVYQGDAQELVPILDERFDCIVAGDVLEHVADPWTLLSLLRSVAAPGGSILMSVPNAANWAIVADLLRGRFDYTYIGIACAGHVRFFTRESIADTLEMAGWEVVSIEPQAEIVSSETTALFDKLRSAGAPFDESAMRPTGFYVVARNPL